jgi:hypothetical protein
VLTEKLLDEINAGEGLTLAQLAKRCPRTRKNRPVSLGCVLRWVLDGAAGPDGNKVKLEAARLAGKWVTTARAFARFVAGQTPTAEPEPFRTTAKRLRAADHAGDELEARGV